MPKPLIIFPFGGNAREALATILDINKIHKEWDVLGFVDDDASKHGQEFNHAKVLGSKDVLKSHPEAYVLAVPGNVKNFKQRQTIINSLGIDSSKFATVIHPSAVIAQDADIGHNTFIAPQVVVSCTASIGNHCLILPGTVVHHDSMIEDYCCVGANVTIAGSVRIKKSSYIGSSSSIREHVMIEERALVGMGSNVLEQVRNDVTVVGNPAREIPGT